MNITDMTAVTCTQPEQQAICDTPSKISLPTTSTLSASTVKRRSIPTSVMVHAAIKSQMLTSRSSVSFTAIKKYIKQTYLDSHVDINNRVKHIKKYILNALEQGRLLRSKGRGLSGSFRVPPDEFRAEKAANFPNVRKPRATKKSRVLTKKNSN